MLTRHVGRIASPFLLLTAVATGVVAFGYVRLLDVQGTPVGQSSRTAWVLAVLLLVAATALAGAFTSVAAWRAVASGIAVGVLLPLGFLAAFSIGTPLLLGGVLAAFGWAGALLEDPSRSVKIRSCVACVGSVLALALGFVVSA